MDLDAVARGEYAQKRYLLRVPLIPAGSFFLIYSEGEGVFFQPPFDRKVGSLF